MEVIVKNMVCQRCVKVVRDELNKAGIMTGNIELGKVELLDTNCDLAVVSAILEENGFALLEDRSAKIIEKIKTTLIEFIYSEEIESFEGKVSELLVRSLAAEYSSLSTLFSSTEGITIEKFFIRQKIERVKEFLMYDELTLSEISYKLGYSSVQHLSNQFKKCTGMAPSKFKDLAVESRTPLDEI